MIALKRDQVLSAHDVCELPLKIRCVGCSDSEGDDGPDVPEDRVPNLGQELRKMLVAER
jgi:hypothetical protein